ncbi:MAG TPA: PspA/IM30 family protein, partial [Myxococcales bacterium]|nr:PspA/IM30 family protein [Myxococcales bacterium]
GKADEELARAALERSVVQERIGAQIAAQLVEVKAQVEQLKGALGDLRHKVDEVRAKSELLVARQRRARAAVRSSTKGTSSDPQEGLRRMEAKVRESEAIGKAEVELAAGDMDDRLERLEMEDRVERLLEEMRQRRSLPVHGTDAPGR